MTIPAHRILAWALFASLAGASGRVLEIRETALSPDGTRVAWVQEIETPKPGTAIFVQDLRPSSASPARITAGSGGRGLSWSADGQSLAFLVGDQLYVQAITGNIARRVTRFQGSVADPKWSPDGKTIAVLVTESATGPQGPTTPKSNVPGDATGQIPEQRIFTVDAASGRIHKTSSADLYVYEYDWSPDSKSFAAIAAHGDGDNNWYIAQLYIITAASGETRSLWKPPLQMAVPRWSPDGRSIAVIEGLMSDESINGGDVFLAPAAGGEPRNLTPGMKASASWIAWKSATQILISESIDGQGGLATLDITSGRMSTISNPLASGLNVPVYSGLNGPISLAKDGEMSALVLYEFDRPPEVWAGPLASWKQITHINTGVPPAWGKATSLHWDRGGFQIQGWLIEPVHYDPARRYPMVVAVHGGPSSMARPRWVTDSSPYVYKLVLLANDGYFVFLPNARGSYGQGEVFTQANVKDFGHGDLEDILAGVDAVVRSYPVDKDRVGLAGWSYGGYMAMWTATQTQRFGAIVAGAGIANWQSYYGENEIDQWLIPFFGASVYDDPAVYRRSSPMEFVKNAKTPTLILVGEKDGECPLPQSLEFWHALKTLGVETKLMVYAGEGHDIAGEEHRRDIMNRTRAWFDQHLKR